MNIIGVTEVNGSVSRVHKKIRKIDTCHKIPLPLKKLQLLHNLGLRVTASDRQQLICYT